MSALTHFDAQGQAHMVDVGGKAATHRPLVQTGRSPSAPDALALATPLLAARQRFSAVLR